MEIATAGLKLNDISHGQASHQSHNFRPDDFRSNHFRPGPAHDRHGNDRRDWDGRRGFAGGHFGSHRFVDRHDPRRNFFAGRGLHHDGRHVRYRVDRYFQPRGYHSYAWHRGDRLPVAYYAPRYIIGDYRAYHLGVPPRGYHWVRVNNDVLLAAITTGIVVQVVNDLFW